jgi:hypothetical protein
MVGESAPRFVFLSIRPRTGLRNEVLLVSMLGFARKSGNPGALAATNSLRRDHSLRGDGMGVAREWVGKGMGGQGDGRGGYGLGGEGVGGALGLGGGRIALATRVERSTHLTTGFPLP